MHGVRPSAGATNPVTGFADGTGPRAARVVAGLFGLAVGVLAIVWPGITAVVLAVLVGAWAIVTGIADLWLAARQHGGWTLALVGAISVVAGLFVVVRPEAGAVAIAWAIGLYAIVSGALLLVAAYQLTHQGRGASQPPTDPCACDTWACTMRQPSGRRTQVWDCLPGRSSPPG